MQRKQARAAELRVRGLEKRLVRRGERSVFRQNCREPGLVDGVIRLRTEPVQGRRDETFIVKLQGSR